MDFVSVRDFRNASKSIWDKLEAEGKLVITNNGKPQALLLPVDGSTLEEALFDISRIEAKRAVRSLQKASAANGISTMTMDEINAEIAKAREERHTQEVARFA